VIAAVSIPSRFRQVADPSVASRPSYVSAPP
jgi:hypothetical protein